MSMIIDARAFYSEMNGLLSTSIERWKNQVSHPPVFSVNIWTDPDAKVSALSIDTRENYNRWAANRRRFTETQIARFRRLHNDRMVRVLDKPLPSHCDNPADFAYPMLNSIRNESYSKAKPIDKNIWDELEPMLLIVRDQAAIEFARFDHDQDAEATVNDRSGWCASPIKIL